MKKIVIVGGGSFIKNIINYIENNPDFEIIGYTDVEDHGIFLGVPYIGTDDVLSSLFTQGVKNAVVGVGNQLNDYTLKEKITNKVLALGFVIPTLYGQNMVIHRDVKIGEGCIIRDGANIQAGCVIKPHVIIGDRAIVTHDTIIESYAQVVSGAIVGRECHLGKGTFVGYGAIILNGIQTAERTLIGANSLINKSCTVEGGRYLGSPAVLK